MKHIPNILTCFNLLLGCLALIFVFDDNMHYASLAVGAALIFDFADGFFARLLKAQSQIGKDLDSLADLVSFGVVPSTVIFMYMVRSANFPQIHGILWFAAMPAFIVTVFSAIRLAKFNNDIRQSESFIGLPTPANAFFFMSFPLLLRYSEPGTYIYIATEIITGSYYNLLIITALSSALLISNIPLFSLKFKTWRLSENLIKYIFITVSLLLLVILFTQALPLIIIFYLFLSLINNLIS